MAESGLFDKQKSGILRAMLDSNSTFHMTIKLHFYWTSTRRLKVFGKGSDPVCGNKL